MIDRQRRLRRFLVLSAAAYGAGAVLFATRPGDAVRTMGLVGGQPPPDPERVWNALSVAYMGTIATAAATAAADPLRRGAVVPAIVVAKLTSSAMLARQYLRTRSRAYLVGVATDVPLALATWGLFWAAKREAKRSAKREARREAERG